MPTPAELFFGVMFSIVGMGYIAFGRKNNFFFLLAGMCLLAVTFFSLDLITYIICAIVLCIAPFILTFFF